MSLTGEPGLLVDFEDDAKADDYFLRVFGEENVDSIVEETNRYARQSLQSNARCLVAWKDITKPEMKAFFGICVIMGINQLPRIADYWKDDPFIGNEGIKRTMPRNCFQEISQFLHFADSTKNPARGEKGYDRLFKVRPVLNATLENSQRCYSPNKHIAVDEGMIAFKGRLSFWQYMPAKPTKYGIKVWMAADSKNGYVVNFDVYLGSKEGAQRIHGLGYDVVIKMIKPYMNKNHHVYFDNFFSSTVLLEHLELQQTYASSTVRCNRKGLATCAKNKLTRPGELVQAQKENILFTKWHDKRDVAFLATNVSPGEASHTVQRKVRGRGREIEIVKPHVTDVYTANMGGFDRADQRRSYYYVGRQSRKWYKYLFWFSFNLAACNAYIVESESREKQRPQDTFHLELGKRLIGNFNSRKRPANAATPLVPRDPLTHTSTKIDGCKKQCVNCKAKGQKTPKNYPMETKFKCVQCGVALSVKISVSETTMQC